MGSHGIGLVSKRGSHPASLPPKAGASSPHASSAQATVQVDFIPPMSVQIQLCTPLKYIPLPRDREGAGVQGREYHGGAGRPSNAPGGILETDEKAESGPRITRGRKAVSLRQLGTKRPKGRFVKVGVLPQWIMTAQTSRLVGRHLRPYSLPPKSLPSRLESSEMISSDISPSPSISNPSESSPPGAICRWEFLQLAVDRGNERIWASHSTRPSAASAPNPPIAPGRPLLPPACRNGQVPTWSTDESFLAI